MDSISYRNVTFTILRSISWEREPQFDPSGTTYLDTRWRGAIIVAYNPEAESYGLNAGGTAIPVAGRMPAQTDAAIRTLLEQPRGQLLVMSNGTTVLRSPAFLPTGVPAACDTRNGPFIKVNSIQQISGERLWNIHLEIETYINERTPGPDGNPNANTRAVLFLSNRWYISDDTNWQHLRTRTFQGICTVRADRLQGSVTPNIDSFRDVFASFSVPAGFQRESVKVTVTPDGNSAHYTVVDTEQIFNKTANCPAVRIETIDTDWVWRGSCLRALRQMGGSVTVVARGVAAIAYGLSGSDAGRAMAVQVVQEGLLGATRAAVDNLPKGYKNVVVRGWGNQRTSRNTLVQYAMAVALGRLGVIPRAIASDSETLVTQDSSNSVTVSMTINWGLDIGLLIIPSAISGIPTDVLDTRFPSAPGMDPRVRGTQTQVTINGLGQITHGQGLAGAQGANVPFPADSGTRGTASLVPSNVGLQTLVTQALEGFNGTVGVVP
jgi:hypothetical protein